jgi:hypothetical protein
VELNYVTKMEILVIAGILLVAAYLFYSLDLFKKGK